jgi:hypothetical protein
MVWFFFSTTRWPRRVEAPITTTLSPFISRASPGDSSVKERKEQFEDKKDEKFLVLKGLGQDSHELNIV